MKLLRLFTLFNFCLLSYVGSIHALEHGVDYDHQTDCIQCIAVSVTDNWSSPEELIVDDAFVIEVSQAFFLKFVHIQSNQIELPLSRGPPLNLI